MSTSELATAPTTFINVQVVAIPTVDPSTGRTRYQTEFYPPSITVTQADTVVNYQLATQTPAGVQFTGLTISPEHANQFSKATISPSGKIITFSDANTAKETIGITLHFKDKDEFEFNVDPDIVNEPRPV